MVEHPNQDDYENNNSPEIEDTAGWDQTDEETKNKFETFLTTLKDAGVQIFSRKDDPSIDSYEATLSEMPELWRTLYRFEFQWPLIKAFQ